MEYRIVRKDGAIRNILCNTSTIRLFGNDEPLLLSVGNDITELREAQRKELAVSDRLSTVLNTMSNAITAVAYHDNGVEFLFANNRFYEMYGIRHGDIGEKHLSDALNIIVPQHREAVRNAIRSAVKAMKTSSIEYQIMRPDGVERWIRATINMIKPSDISAPVQVLVLSDITDEKKANDQIRFLNESAGEILAQPDSEKAIMDTLSKLLKYFAGERAYVFEFNEATKTTDNTYEICLPGITSEKNRLQCIPYETQRKWFDAFEKIGYVAISDVTTITDENDVDSRNILLEQNIRSLIVAPMWRDDKLIGYIGVDNPTKAVDEVSQLIALSDYIAVLLTRRDLTRAIENGQQMVQQLMDDAPGGFLRLRIQPDGTPVIVSLNEGFCRLLGMTSDEVMAAYGLDAHKCLIADDVETVKNASSEALAENGAYTYKCRLKKKGGAVICVQVFGRYVRGENGELFRNSFFTDITEERNAEQLQSDLLDNLPFGAAMYEYDGKTITTIHMNKRYGEMINRKVDIAHADYMPINAVYPDDRKIIFERLSEAIKNKCGASCDVRLHYGDEDSNEYRYFHLDGAVTLSADGKYILYVAYQHITDKELELKRTSEQLKLLSENMPGGIATFRCMPGKIEPIFYTDGICTLTGYSREEIDSPDVSILGIIFDEDKPIIKRQTERLKSGEKELACSVRIHTKNGGYKWVECMANVTERNGDEAFLVSTVLTDVTVQQEERERLRVSEEINRLAINQSGKIISRYDVATHTLTLPYKLPDIYNLPGVLYNMPEEQISLGRISPDTAEIYRNVFNRIHNGEASGEAVYQQSSTLGWRWLKTQFTTVFANDGKPVFAVASFDDITEQREKEAIYMRWQNTMLERNADSYTLVRCTLNKPDVVDSWDGSLLRIRFSKPILPFNARTTEYAKQYVYADDLNDFCAFLNCEALLEEYHRGHRSDAIDYREKNDDGGVCWLRLTVDMVEYPDSKDVEAYLLFENINEKKHSELSTIRRAETDSLTGVLNRTTFVQRVNQAISRFGAQTIHALFILDIDDFKYVNDLFGHGAGDETLVDFADTLTHFCRKNDLVCRLGGDEFFVFIADVGDQDSVAKKARRLCKLARKSIHNTLQISISIGIAMFPMDGNNFEILYKAADEALYRTKNAGKDGYSFTFGNSVNNIGDNENEE